MTFNFLNVFSKIKKDNQKLNEKVNNTQAKIEREYNHQLDEFEKAKMQFKSHN